MTLIDLIFLSKGPFDAIKKVFTSGEEYARMSFQDKSDLFFCDYSIMPLFVFENYVNVTPSKKFVFYYYYN